MGHAIDEVAEAFVVLTPGEKPTRHEQLERPACAARRLWIRSLTLYRAARRAA
jgi:hypothetical protein